MVSPVSESRKPRPHLKANREVVLPPHLTIESHTLHGSAVLTREIALLTKGYYDLQELRKSFANRIRQYDIKEPLWFNTIKTIENTVHKELTKKIKTTPYSHALEINGVGPLIVGGLLMHTYNFKKDVPCQFDGVRSLWHYAGQHVVNGVAPKERKKQKVDWSPRFRKWLISVGQMLIRGKGPYRKIYELERERSEANPTHKDWNKGHHFNHAKRLMVKQLLKDWFVFVEKLKTHTKYESQVRSGFV